MDLHYCVLHYYVQPNHLNFNSNLFITFYLDIPGLFQARSGPFLEQNGHLQRVASDDLHADNNPVYRVVVARLAIRDGLVLDRHSPHHRPNQPYRHLLHELLQFIPIDQEVMESF